MSSYAYAYPYGSGSAGPFTFTGAAYSYLTATSRRFDGTVGGYPLSSSKYVSNQWFTLSAWLYVAPDAVAWGKFFDFGDADFGDAHFETDRLVLHLNDQLKLKYEVQQGSTSLSRKSIDS